jgi:hypothetical protein
LRRDRQRRQPSRLHRRRQYKGFKLVPAVVACAIGLVALLLMPLVLYWLYPPQIRSTPNAAQFARSKLAERGPLAQSMELAEPGPASDDRAIRWFAGKARRLSG